MRMWTLWLGIGAESKTHIEVGEWLTEHQTEVGDSLDEIRIVWASRQDKIHDKAEIGRLRLTEQSDLTWNKKSSILSKE